MKKVIIIFAILFTLVIIYQAVMFLPLLFFGFEGGESQDYIPLASQKKVSENPEEFKIPVFNIPKIVETSEMKNIKINCAKEKDIWPEARKEKMLCENVYTADVEKIKKEAQKSNPQRIVFYGAYSILDCPISLSSPRKVDDPIGDCFDAAKFLDGYMIPKMASIYKPPKQYKRLFVYLEEDADKIEKSCNFPAGGCYKSDFSIIMNFPSMDSKLFTNGKEYRNTFIKDVSVGPSYYFWEIIPKNCEMGSTSLHEMIHFFNRQIYGRTPSWFEESMTNIIYYYIGKEICPPGLADKDVRKFEGGAYENVDNFDPNDDKYITDMQDKRLEGSVCAKAVVTQINRLVKSGGVAYYQKLLKVMNTKVQYDYYREITIDRLAAAVVESTGNNQGVKDYLYKTSGCPKEKK
jgi:hypothetical protein